MERCPTCRACGEESSFCTCFGGIGVSETPFGVPRHRWMFTAAAINIVVLILLVLGALGVSTSEGMLKTFYWSKVDLDGGTLFIGPNAVFLDLDSNMDTANLNVSTGTTSWGDLDCDTEAVDADQCDSCKAAATGTVGTAVVGVVTTLPTIQTDFQRSTRAGDLNCQKFMALFTGLAGGISSLVTLVQFAGSCWKVSGYDTVAGPGFILQLVGTIIKFIDIPMHMVLLTPPEIRNKAFRAPTTSGDP